MKRIHILTVILLPVLCLLLSACTAGAPAPAGAPAAEPAAAVQQEAPQQAQQAEQASPPQEQPAPDVTAAAPTAGTEPATQSVQASPAAPADAEAQGQPAAEREDRGSLKLEGAGLKASLSLSLDELKGMEASIVEDDFFSLNSYGTKEYFHFRGVRLSEILQKAGLAKETGAVTFTASDGYEVQLTLEQAMKEDYIDEQDPSKRYPVIIAWQENGQEYDLDRGYPFRLVIGQKEAGDVNKPQWVMNIAKITVD